MLPLFESLVVYCIVQNNEIWGTLNDTVPFTDFYIRPRLSIYFSSGDTKNVAQFTEEPPPVHNTSNIQLNTAPVYLSCTLHVQYRRLTSNWSLNWSFRLPHGLSIASCVDRLDCRIRKLLDWSSDWLSACCRRRNVATRILIGTYRFIIPPLCVFMSRDPWHPFEEPSLRNTDIRQQINLSVNSDTQPSTPPPPYTQYELIL